MQNIYPVKVTILQHVPTGNGKKKAKHVETKMVARTVVWKLRCLLTSTWEMKGSATLTTALL